MPQLENAILSGQDIIFLGERGQAKSRMIRALDRPARRGDPGHRRQRGQRRPVRADHARQQDAHRRRDGRQTLAIEWIGRDRRYGEKLATPDITIADLIGEVDPIKVAEGRYLSDELTIHYGLIPRTNRGIFCINELPDLAERIQVGLLNIMEERDVQIRGYQHPHAARRRSSSRQREPGGLHQPRPHHHAAEGPLRRRRSARTTRAASSTRSASWTQERIALRRRRATRSTVPQYMKEIVAEITRLARRSPDVNQRSGVSVRASIADYESLLANALRRAIQRWRDGRRAARQRPALRHPGDQRQGRVRDGRRRQGRADPREADPGRRRSPCSTATSASRTSTTSSRGSSPASQVEVGDMMPSANYVKLVKQVDGLSEHVAKLDPARTSAPVTASRRRVHPRGPAPEQAPQQRPGRRRNGRSTGARARSTAPGSGDVRQHGHQIVAFRYSEWDGTQEIPPLDPDDVLNALTDDLMNFGDLQHALRNLHAARHAQPARATALQGLRDLLQQLRQQRRQNLDQFQPLVRLSRTSRIASRDPRERAQHPRRAPRRRAGRPAGRRRAGEGRGRQERSEGGEGQRRSRRSQQSGQQGGQQVRRRARQQAAGQRRQPQGSESSRVASSRRRRRQTSSPRCCKNIVERKRNFLEGLPHGPPGPDEGAAELRVHGPGGAGTSSRS